MKRITNDEFLGFGVLESRMVVRDGICTVYCFGASDGDRVAQGYPFSCLSFIVVSDKSDTACCLLHRVVWQ